MPFPIDPQTVADALKIGEWGKVQGNTILEKWTNWQEMELKRQLLMKLKAQELTGGELPEGGGPHGTHAGGRKPSGGAMPQMSSKSDGRPVTKESR